MTNTGESCHNAMSVYAPSFVYYEILFICGRQYRSRKQKANGAWFEKWTTKELFWGPSVKIKIIHTIFIYFSLSTVNHIDETKKALLSIISTAVFNCVW